MQEAAQVVQLFETKELTCSRCRQTKSIKEFSKDKHTKNGHSYWCKGCYRPMKKESGRKWRSSPENMEKNRQRDRWYQRKKAYGITKQQFLEMLFAQNGVCPICKMVPKGDVEKVMHVDHNHATGKIRGLLCYICNRALGLFRDSPTILKNAAQYLEERGSYGKT